MSKIGYLYKIKVSKDNSEPFTSYFISRNVRTLKDYIKENYEGIVILDILKIGEDKNFVKTREFSDSERLSVENWYRNETLKMAYANQLIKGETMNGEEEKTRILNDRKFVYPRES